MHWQPAWSPYVMDCISSSLPTKSIVQQLWEKKVRCLEFTCCSPNEHKVNATMVGSLYGQAAALFQMIFKVFFGISKLMLIAWKSE